MKKINIIIESKNNITIDEARKIVDSIEKSLPKDIKIEWTGWDIKK